MSENWAGLARESRNAANILVKSNYRSAVSRAYYASYAKLCQEFVDSGLCLPGQGPSHRDLRPMLLKRLGRISENERKTLSQIIGRLYTLRLDADYHPLDRIDSREAREAISLMKTVFEAF